ncbi:MAG TPA: acyl carrier protein, partial [Nitrospira sp.]
CMHWGPIDDVGFLARHEDIKHTLYRRMGSAGIPASAALDALEEVLVGDRSDEGVLSFSWSALSQWLPAAGASRYLELGACHSDRTESSEQGPDLRQLLHGMTDTARLAAVVDLLKRELSVVSGLPPEKMAADRSLHEMGLDSLMGAELVMAISKRVDVTLPMLALAENTTVVELAKRILDLLTTGGPTDRDESADQMARLVKRHGADVEDEGNVRFRGDMGSDRRSDKTVVIDQGRI